MIRRVWDATEPTEETPNPAEDRERGHVQKTFHGGVKAELTLRLAEIYNQRWGKAFQGEGTA